MCKEGESHVESKEEKKGMEGEGKGEDGKENRGNRIFYVIEKLFLGAFATPGRPVSSTLLVSQKSPPAVSSTLPSSSRKTLLNTPKRNLAKMKLPSAKKQQ